MPTIQSTLPNLLRSVEQFKAALEARKSGKSLADVSEQIYGNSTCLPAAFRKARDLCANPDGVGEDKAVAEQMLAMWRDASSTAGKRVGSAPAPLSADAAKEMLAALNGVADEADDDEADDDEAAKAAAAKAKAAAA